MAKLHYSIEGNIVTAEVFQGEKYSEKTETVSVTTFDLLDCPEVLKDGNAVKTFASYGLLKWLQDRTSQVKGASDKVSAMVVEFDEKAKAGLWKTPAKVGETSAKGSRRKITASLAGAVAALLGCTPIEAEANLKALDKVAFEGLVANPKVVAKVAELNEGVAAADGSALNDLL